MENNKKNWEFLFLIYLITFICALLIMNLIEYVQNDLYLLTMPKTRDAIGWGLLIFFALVALFGIYRLVYLLQRKQNKKGIILAIIMTSISLTLFLNLVQFKLYSSNPDSYDVDSKVKSFYAKRDSSSINNLINIYKNEISLIEELNNTITASTIIPKFNNSETAKSNPAIRFPGYYICNNKVELYFREIENPAPEPPPITGIKELPDSMIVINRISIAKQRTEITIPLNKDNRKFFDALNISNYHIKTSLLNRITNIHAEERKQRISTLNKNKVILMKRGLPIEIILIDSISTFFGDSQDYKALSWLGKLIENVQRIFAFCIFIPLVIYNFLKKRIGS